MYAEETQRRALIKTVSWRAIATLLMLCVVYLYTGEIVISLATTFTVAIVNTTAYYLHERIWNKTTWGKRLVRKRVKQTPQRA